MKALTIRQPYAQCVARGVKTVENRTHGTVYRGLLAIHAGAAWSEGGGADPLVLAELLAEVDAGADMSESLARDVMALPFGAVIAVADLVDTHPARGCCEPWGWPDRVGARAIVHWVLADVRLLAAPVPALGRLGMWEWSAPTEIVNNTAL